MKFISDWLWWNMSIRSLIKPKDSSTFKDFLHVERTRGMKRFAYTELRCVCGNKNHTEKCFVLVETCKERKITLYFFLKVLYSYFIWKISAYKFKNYVRIKKTK